MYVVTPKTCRILLLSAFYLKDACIRIYLSRPCFCLRKNTANNALIIEKNMFNFNPYYVKMHSEKMFAKCIHYDNSMLRP